MNSVLMGLATMTQMLPWDAEGQEIGPEALAEPPVAAAEIPPAPDGEATSTAGGAPAADPGEEATAAVIELVMGIGPLFGLSARMDPPGPAPSDRATPSGGSPAFWLETPERHAESGPIRPMHDGRAVRWAVAVVAIAAAYRGREVIRGLRWKKRAVAGSIGARSVVPVAPTSRSSGMLLRDSASRPHSVHAILSRSAKFQQAASPRP
jgi:hypothetical protein